jgi:hypothetical protein
MARTLIAAIIDRQPGPSQSTVDVKNILPALLQSAQNSCCAFAIMAETTTLMGDLPAAAAGNVCSGSWSGFARSREAGFG